MVNLPRGYLSVSQIEMYQRCPRQYRYRYVEDKISPPGIALVFGSAAHHALEITHRTIAACDEPSPTEEICDAFSDAFELAVPECKLQDGDDVGASKDQGVTLVKIYNETEARRVQPSITLDGEVWIERKIEATIAGIPMVGIIDLVDEASGSCVISDIKTSSKSKPQSDTDASLQLTFYSAVTGISEVRHDVLVKTKKPKVERNRSRRGLRDYAWLNEVVGSVAEAISRGAFPPCDATSWCCSEKWCGYWDVCRGAKR